MPLVIAANDEDGIFENIPVKKFGSFGSMDDNGFEIVFSLELMTPHQQNEWRKRIVADVSMAFSESISFQNNFDAAEIMGDLVNFEHKITSVHEILTEPMSIAIKFKPLKRIEC